MAEPNLALEIYNKNFDKEAVEDKEEEPNLALEIYNKNFDKPTTDVKGNTFYNPHKMGLISLNERKGDCECCPLLSLTFHADPSMM